jgi:hypothetical protein
MWPGAQNTGILCRLCPTLDIDLLDPDAAEAVEQLVKDRFGEHGRVLPRVGKPPKRAIVFRTQKPLAKITALLLAAIEPDGKRPDQRVEFLCDGQQVVVDGIHPETRQPYRWHAGCVGDIKRDDLPEISEDEARAVVEDIVDLLTKEHGYRSVNAKGQPGTASKPANGRDPAGPADWAAPADLIDHDLLCQHAMRLLASGMAAGAAVQMLRAQVAGLQGVDPERKQRRLAEIPDIVASAQNKIGAREPQPEPQHYSGLFVDMSAWTNDNAPPREWAVRERIPLNQPTLFSGEGAAGKSTAELQLCCAHVLGRDWLGMLPELGGAIYLGAEDQREEVHRRLADIARFYQVEISELIASGFHYINRAGDDALLGRVASKGGVVEATPLYGALLELAGDLKPKHIGIDTSADVFGGNEIDRAQVRQFIGMLRKIAMVGNCAVVLLSHPSLTGIKTGSGISGSTHWHNSVRARMYLHAPKVKNDQGEEREQVESDLRELEFMKNNYGPVAGRLVLTYRNGLYLPVAGETTIERAAREQRIDEVFLSLLRKLEDQHQPVSPSRTSPQLCAQDLRGAGGAQGVHHSGLCGSDAAAHRPPIDPCRRIWAALPATAISAERTTTQRGVMTDLVHLADSTPSSAGAVATVRISV